jgi:predicted nuclease of predicted toxin-antitoxin system
MKLLIDTCVSGEAVKILIEAGHDLIWTGEWDQDPGDEEILNLAHTDGRILVTLDKDFCELAIVFGQPHSGIIRLVDFRSRDQGTVCLKILELHADELTRGAIITADYGRLRIRSAPD